MANKNIKLSKEAQDFLFYSYFRQPWEKLKSEKEIAVCYCFRRAYRDFNRTLNFDKGKRESDDFSYDIFYGVNGGEALCRKIMGLIRSQPTNFDKHHEKLCEQIIKNADKINYLDEVFYYGQAQKWVNMTLKYMSFMGIWDDEFYKIKKCLHVPLDNNVFKALIEERGIKKEGRKNWVSCIKKEGGQPESYKVWYNICDEQEKLIQTQDRINRSKGEEKSVWSKIDDKVYKNIQNMIASNIEGCRFDWECQVWLEMAASSTGSGSD